MSDVVEVAPVMDSGDEVVRIDKAKIKFEEELLSQLRVFYREPTPAMVVEGGLAGVRKVVTGEPMVFENTVGSSDRVEVGVGEGLLELHALPLGRIYLEDRRDIVSAWAVLMDDLPGFVKKISNMDGVNQETVVYGVTNHMFADFLSGLAVRDETTDEEKRVFRVAGEIEYSPSQKQKRWQKSAVVSERMGVIRDPDPELLDRWQGMSLQDQVGVLLKSSSQFIEDLVTASRSGNKKLMVFSTVGELQELVDALEKGRMGHRLEKMFRKSRFRQIKDNPKEMNRIRRLAYMNIQSEPAFEKPPLWWRVRHSMGRRLRRQD